MRTNLEDITSVKKKLSVEIESEEVDRKFNKAYKELGKQVKIPGFRPGKVPRKILERHIGSQVTEDVAKDLINETLPGALEEVKTFPLGVPTLEKETLKQGQDFKYSAIMEVRPQFEIANYLGLDVEKETCSVTEQDVQDQLAQIRNAHGTLTSIDSNRPIKKNDDVVLDYQGFEKGQPLEEIHASNFLLKVGDNNFHPKFEESLIGLKKDDEAETKVEFEVSYPHTKLAGKTVDFKIKIIDIKKMVLPELNDEFAQNADELATIIAQNRVGYGDCEDSAVLLAVMYKGAGFRSAIAIGSGHTAAAEAIKDDVARLGVVFDEGNDVSQASSRATLNSYDPPGIWSVANS